MSAATRVCVAAELLVPNDYPTIQEAIDRAAAGDVVVIAPGTYTENLTLKTDVDVRGRETARVLLAPDRSNAATVLIDGVSSIVLANITFVDSEVAVQVQDSTDVTVASTVFDSAEDVALLTDRTSTVTAMNNVFFANDAAIRRSSDDTEITNNVFARNRATIASALGVDDDAAVRFNCFFANDDLTQGGMDTALGSNFQIGDPRFVATDRRDFHFQQASPCIDAGTGTDAVDNSVADIGAYGGSFADALPFPVPQPAVRDVSAGQTFSLELSWQRNLSYLVTNNANPGGYRVYYRQNQPGPPFDGVDAGGGTQPSPIDVGDVATFTLSNLQPAVAAPAAPQLLSAEPRANAVVLTWTATDNVVGYTIRYGLNSVGENRLDVGNVTTYTVTGLANDTMHRFAVAALGQPTYHLAVTALDNTPLRHESALSQAPSVRLGAVVASGDSGELTATPQVTIPVPDLPDEGGCFIATAAYGADWAAEVQILRDFRDRYLATNALGRELVRVYYEMSPAASRYLDAHPRLKLPVRVGLAPIVAGALRDGRLGRVAEIRGRRAGVPTDRFRSAPQVGGPRPIASAVMTARGFCAAIAVGLSCGFGMDDALAQQAQPIASPRWMFEIKGGDFEPELQNYEQFYGEDDAQFIAAGFAYRFRAWLEAGAEIGGMREKGMGILASEGVPGGQVTYALTPLHVFVNLRGLFKQDQLFVPYVGFGASAAYYQEDIELQSERTGTSELGSNVRVGLQLFLNRLDSDVRSGYADGPVKQSFLFIEAQRFTTEQDGIDLGGDALLLGFRFELGRDAGRPLVALRPLADWAKVQW